MTTTMKESLTSKDVILLLSQTLQDLKSGKISLRKAKGLSSLCQNILKARESNEKEEESEIIELV